MTALPQLIVVAGLDHHAVRDVARALCRRDGTAAVGHELRGPACAHRWTRHRGRDRVDAVDPARVADDLATAVDDLAADPQVQRIVVPLDPGLEPGPVCCELLGTLDAPTDRARHLDFRGVVTVVDEPGWLADATGSTTLADRGLGTGDGDARTVAQVAVEQVESADAIVLTGRTDLATAVRTGAVLARLAPGVRRRRAGTGADADLLLDERPDRGERARLAADVHGRLLRGEPPLSRDGGVAWLLFSAAWPMHPGRLHDAVPLLLRGCVRARGRIWLAGRPDDVLWLESAGGGLRVEQAGRWLAAGGPDGPDTWATARPARRTFASLRWHARFGDRAQDLVALVHDGGAGELAIALRAALLTPGELAAGPAAWARWDDPFGARHVDPCGALHAHPPGTSAPHAVRLPG